jgi:hypothetical protein
MYSVTTKFNIMTVVNLMFVLDSLSPGSEERREMCLRQIRANDPSLKSLGLRVRGGKNPDNLHLLMRELKERNTQVNSLTLFLEDLPTQELPTCLADMLAVNRTITNFCISGIHNHKDRVSATCLLVLQALASVADSLRLTTLEFSHIDISVPEAEALRDLLLLCPSLAEIKLGAATIRAFSTVMDGIKRSNVSCLNLKNYISDGEMFCLSRAITGNHISSLRVKAKDANVLGQLGFALHNNNHLSHLDVIVSAGHPWESPARFARIRQFTESASTMTNLKHFGFIVDGRDDASLGHSVLDALVEFVRGHKSITSFTLDMHGPIGEDTDSRLLTLKPCLGGLEDLTLCIRSSGGQSAVDLSASLVETFRDNTSLRRLDLSRNALTDSEMTALSSVLPSMTRLSSLNVALNSFYLDGATSLLAGVQASPNLTDVELQPNCRDLMPIENRIHFCCKLRKIDYPKLLVAAPMSLWPRVFASKLDQGQWYSIMYSLLLEKNDVLIQR